MTKPFSPKLLTARVKSLLIRRSNNPIPGDGKIFAENSPEPLMVKTLGRCELRVGNRSLSWTEEFSPAQRQLMAMLVGASSGKVSQEEVQVALWPDSTSTRARSSFDSLLSRVRRTLDQALAPFDSKKYLVVKRGYLCLEHSLVDAHEFRRLIRKANLQVSAGELWPAEITFSSAFSLWRGTFVPGDFGSDAAIIFQDELEQLYLDSSQTFARLLAQNERYQEAAKLLRDALRYEPTNDGVVRLLYSLCLAQESPGLASQIIKQYSEALCRENFPAHEIEEALLDFPREKSAQGWLNQG
jgi:DNA-binding SARP family transcriptional activator